MRGGALCKIFQHESEVPSPRGFNPLAERIFFLIDSWVYNFKSKLEHEDQLVIYIWAQHWKEDSMNNIKS